MKSDIASPPPPPHFSPKSSSQSGSSSHGHLSSSTSPYLNAHSTDPRHLSTQSLVPSTSDSDGRRKLLVIYIHGFYGNAQSFKSFPAHVHSLLRALLSETHVIHSKIYPRYKTYKAIEIARDNFSTWLEPHESSTTDVVLVGHSMGGLLAGDVILMPNESPYLEQAFKHRILGTIALDSPYLGLHPGIVVSGIASLFRPSAEQEDGSKEQNQDDNGVPAAFDSASSLGAWNCNDSQAESIGTPAVGPTLVVRQATDPHFDPPYANDAPFREKPLVKRLVNFAVKHRNKGLLNSVVNHVNSHLEFGGCLADYAGLKRRYRSIRELEDVDEVKAMAEGHPLGAFSRVRFVNYYTLCPGRPKQPKKDDEQDCRSQNSQKVELPEGFDTVERQEPHVSEISTVTSSSLGSPDQAPASLNETKSPLPLPLPTAEPEENAVPEPVSDDDSGTARLSMLSMQEIEPVPLSLEESEETQTLRQLESETQSRFEDDIDIDLLPIPDPPQPPTLPDPDLFSDKNARKLAEKERHRLQKQYNQAVKDQARAVQERDKVIQRRRNKAQKEAIKQLRALEKEQARLDKTNKKRVVQEQAEMADAIAAATKSSDYMLQPSSTKTEASAVGARTKEPTKKLRKFCALPKRVDGFIDPTWIDVYMEDMDEVAAHCGLFLDGPHYSRLVGDVGERIATWAQDDLTKQLILSGG